MAQNNKVKIGIQLDVEQSGIKELQKALQTINNLALNAPNTELGLTDELEEAAKAAKQLESILSSSWNSKLQQFNLSDVKKGIDDTYGSAQKLGQILVKSGKDGQAAFAAFQKAVSRTNIELVESNKLLDDMAQSMANTVKWGVTSSIFNTITGSIQKAYYYSKDLNESLNNIRIVTGASSEEMEKFAKTANSAAQALGASTLGYTDASLIFYQQGLSEEDVKARAEVTLKAANVTGQAASAVSEQLTAVWNGYKVTANEAELYIDKVAAVAAKTGADLEELSTGMGKVASAANAMGVDIDQLNAQLSTVITVTRQAPESVGTAFKTIYARLGDLDIGGVTEDGVELGEVAAQLGQAGINVLDAKGELRDVGTIIEEVASKWNKWNSAQKQAVAIAMAGTRQYNNLLALFENWDMYTAALETSRKAVGTLNKQNDIFLESTEAKLQKLATEAERTYDIIFDDDITNGFADGLRVTLGLFNDFIEGIGGGATALTNLGAIAANVFSKQIGRGLVDIKEKIDIRKNNKANIAFKELMLSYDPYQGMINESQAQLMSQQSKLTALQKSNDSIDAQRNATQNKYANAYNQYLQSKSIQKLPKEKQSDEEKGAIGWILSKASPKPLTINEIFSEGLPTSQERKSEKLKNKADNYAQQDGKLLEQQSKVYEQIQSTKEQIKETQSEITQLEKLSEEVAKNKDPLIEEEMNNMSRILSVKKGLTNEQLKELTANEPKITALKKQTQEIERQLNLEVEGKAAKDYDLKTLEELLYYEQISYKATEQRAAALEEITVQGQISVAYAEEETVVVKQLDSLLKSEYITKEQKIKLQEINNSLNEKDKLTEEETKAILEAQKAILQKQKEAVNNITEATNGRRAEEKGLLGDLKKEEQALENNRENTLKQGDAVIKATKATQIVTGSIQGLTSIIGAISAATDESATAADKLNAGWQGTTGAASAIANMIAPGSGIIVSGVMELGKGLLEVTGIWDQWVDSIKTTEEQLEDINKKLAETKQQTAEIEQINTEVVVNYNADKRSEQELTKIENRFKYLQKLAEKGLLTDDLRGEYENYLDRVQAYNEDILISYDAQGNRIAANTNLIQEAIKEQRKLNEEALKTTFSSDNFTKWKENQNTTASSYNQKQNKENKVALETARDDLAKILGVENLKNSNAMYNAFREFSDLAKDNGVKLYQAGLFESGDSFEKNLTVDFLNKNKEDQKALLNEWYEYIEEIKEIAANNGYSTEIVESYEKQLTQIKKGIDNLNITEKYQNKIEISELANNFTPDWDGLIQYLMYNPELNNATKAANETGKLNAEQFFHAYLDGINTAKYTSTDKDGKVTIDYDKITSEANNALNELTKLYNENTNFAMAFNQLKDIEKSDYDSSTAYHEALDTYLSNLLKEIKSPEELKKYLPAIKAALGDTFTGITVSFNEEIGHAVIGKKGSNANFTTAGEKVARGFAQSWTEGVEAGFMKIGDMKLHIGTFDMTSSLEKMMQDIFPEDLLESLDYTDINNYLLQFEEQIQNGETTVIELLQQYKANLQKSVDEYKTFEQEVARDWVNFQKNTIDPILNKYEKDDESRNIRANIGVLGTYIGTKEQKNEETGKISPATTGTFTTAFNALTDLEKTFSNEEYNPTAADNEGRREALNNLMKEMENLQELAEDVEASYTAAFEKIGETIQEQFNVYDQIAGALQHEERIAQMLYGDDPSKKASILSEQTSNATEKAELARMNMNFYKQELDSLNAVAEEDRDAAWEKDVERAKKAYAESAATWQTVTEAAVQAVQNEYINAIDEIFEEANTFTKTGEDGKTNSFTLEDIGDTWGNITYNDDKYLDAIETQYEKSAITNKYNLALTNASASAQEKIKIAIEEQNKLFEKRNKLTQTDIDRANLKYDLTMKQIALEEARDNATQLRLKRDAQGNMSYTFVADEEEIAQRQQEVEDTKQSLYQLDKEAYRNSLDEFYQMYTEYQNELKEAATLSETERATAMEEIQAKYKDRLQDILGDNADFTSNLTSIINSLYDGTEAPFSQMSSELQNLMNTLNGTGDKSLENTMNSLSDSINTQATNMKNDLAQIYGLTQGDAAKSATEFFSSIETQVKAASDVIGQLSKDNETVMSNITEDWTTAKTYYEEFQKMWKDFVKEDGEFAKAAKLVEETTGKLSGGITNALSTLQSEADDAVEEAVKTAQSTITALKNIFAPLQAENSDTETEENTVLTAGAALQNIADSSNTTNSTITLTAETINSKLDIINTTLSTLNTPIDSKLDTIITKLDSIITNTTSASSNSNISTTDTLNVNVVSIPQDPSLYSAMGLGIATGQKAYQTLTEGQGNWDFAKEKWKSLNDAYWLDTNDGGNRTSEYERLIWKLLRPFFDSNVAAFDSGGYTGSWGLEGKLAMVHEKELILNEEDTENMFKTVSVVRDVAHLINDINMRASAHDIIPPAIETHNINQGNKTLEQKIEIQANFPTASSTAEIEEAFKNIVNIATQKAFEAQL